MTRPSDTSQEKKRAREAARYAANPEKILARNAAYRSKNREKMKAIRAAYKEANREKVAAASSAYYRANREKQLATSKAYNVANRGKTRASCAAYRKANPVAKLALERKRQAAKMRRVPAWADLNAIKMVYEMCPRGHHVDHEIPLQGELVSGLHVENNLQYLPAVENIRKGNSFNPMEFQ